VGTSVEFQRKEYMENIELQPGQVLLNFSPYGIKEGIIKAVKVLGYHVVANAVVIGSALTLEFFKNVQVQYPNYALYATAGVALVNAAIVAIQKWLTTHKPTEEAPSVTSEAPAVG
jgi:hypothetical protein